MWRERSGLGFEIGVARLRMRGFRVLRKAMAVDRGALQWVSPYRPRAPAVGRRSEENWGLDLDFEKQSWTVTFYCSKMLRSTQCRPKRV